MPTPSATLWVWNCCRCSLILQVDDSKKLDKRYNPRSSAVGLSLTDIISTGTALKKHRIYLSIKYSASTYIPNILYLEA